MTDKNKPSLLTRFNSFGIILIGYGITLAILFFTYNFLGYDIDLGEQIDLKGNYHYSETQDIWGGSSELPDYFITAKMVCENSGKKCVVVMEIDYEIYLEELRSYFMACGVNIDLVDPDEITIEQERCVQQQIKNVGLLGNVV